MEKITRITYRAADGEEFDTVEQCLEYEGMLTIPTGVILMDSKKCLITSILKLDECYFAYLPTQEDVDWFLMAHQCYTISCEGRVAAGEHLYYDIDDEECWCSYEEDLKESIKEFDKFTKS